MPQFKIGDRIRARDFGPKHPDCFVEIVVNIIDPSARCYEGLTVRDVCGDLDVSDSSRLGFRTRVPMEGCTHRDWDGRLSLVETMTEVELEQEAEELPGLLRPQA